MKDVVDLSVPREAELPLVLTRERGDVEVWEHHTHPHVPPFLPFSPSRPHQGPPRSLEGVGQEATTRPSAKHKTKTPLMMFLFTSLHVHTWGREMKPQIHEE